jgi:serine/threonine protein kinase
LGDNSLDAVKIIDFGLAEHFRPGVLARSEIVGTVFFAAPELLSRSISKTVPTGKYTEARS